MRRSSWIILLGAGVLLLIVSLLYSLTFAERAPAMTPKIAAQIVESGRLAVERNDVKGLFRLFTDDAMVLGRKREEARSEIVEAMAELRGNFRLTIRNLQVRPEGRSAQVTFTMDVGQRDEKMDVIYFPDLRMRAHLEKVRIPRWLGLFEAEEWKVVELESDPPILPKPDQT